MANRRFFQFLYSKTPMLTALQGSVSISAAAAVSSSNIAGATVTKTGTGEYTITLADSYNALISAGFQIQAATAVDLVPQMKSQTVGSTNLIVVNLNAGATPTNPSAALILYIDLFLRNSSVAF